MPRRTHEFRVFRLGAASGSHFINPASELRKTVASLEAYGTLIRLGPGTVPSTGNVDPETYRGAEIRIVGGTNNGTGTVRVYRVVHGNGSRDGNGKQDAALDLIGSLAYTIGAGLGDAQGGAVQGGEPIADTMVWTPATVATTPRGIAAFIDAVYGGGVTAQAYSPANDTSAILFIPDAGTGDLFLDFADANGTVGAVVSLST